MKIALTKLPKIIRYPSISILDKMIAWDLLKTVSSVLSVIVIIIVSRKFINVLALAIDGTISGKTALDILGLKIIVAIAGFLPASIFMAVLMVLGRMYRDQEMAAIATAGGGVMRIYKAVFLLVFPLSLIAYQFSLYAAPWAEEKMLILTNKDMETADVRGISAGRFSEYSHGDLVFYTEEIDDNQQMHNIFIQNRQHGKSGTINAKHGYLSNLPGGKYIILTQGERSQGTPGKADFILEQFDEYAVRIDKKSSTVFYHRDAVSSEKLEISEKIEDKIELHKRFSIPLGVIFLSLLAVPLAKLSPRGGVYGSLLFAFLIYFVYGNISRVNYSWLKTETIPFWIGQFWVYTLMLFFTGILLVRLYGLKWMIQKLMSGGKL
ncbi:MAG: LPS export ABC transporter permease LptF [Methylococcales bacterium]|nr:LPS export ABC transporter permease LptF [Methylococcales bacterium]